MRYIQLATLRLTPLLTPLFLSLAACGGMSHGDARETESEPLLEGGSDADPTAAQGAAEDSAPRSDADDSAARDGTGAGTIIENQGDLVVVVQLGDAAPSSGQTPAATTARATPASTPTQPTATPPQVSDPQPTLLGRYSDNPITAVPVAAESWVPVEGLSGLEASGIELEVVDDLSVLIIFDNSGSMDAHWDGRTRWEVANLAIYESLAPVRTSLKVAAVRFPMEVECGVPEFDSKAQFSWKLAGEFLDEWIDRALAPAGGTPLGQAFIAADAAIQQASESGLLENRFNVLVITDGEPNCATESELLTDLPAKWLTKGVKTHVLGLPGSSHAQRLLEQIALAGGTADPIAIDTAEQLGDEVLIRTR